MSNETSYDTIFGKMVLEQGLATDAEVQRSIEVLKSRQGENPTTLHNLMIQLGFITDSQAQRLKQSIVEAKATAHQIPGYKILGKLGAGAMAIVYEGVQLSLNRKVAIKVLPKRFHENPEYIARFYKEGQAAGKLNHPNIVQAIDVGEAGGYHYFVMEYVDGKTLYDDLAKGKVFGEEESLEIIIQVSKALAHAHKMGLVHRDVKPKNIMITKDGTVKLADLGLARETTDIETAKTEAGKAYGTPYYISPEQIRGEVDIDGRADIYGLGATFYHMVTGKVPFMADNPADVMKKHLKEQLVPPDHINTTLSVGVSEVIETTMTKNKNDRYSNIEELLEDLESLQEGRPPLQAHRRFNVDELESLEEGEEVEDEEDLYVREIVSRYRMMVLILSVLAGVLGLGLIIAISL